MKILRYIATLLIIAHATNGISAQTIADAWVNMPAHIMPLIGKNARLDMIDLYKAGMSAKIPTFTGDTVHLSALGNTYLNLRTSKASTIQLKQIKSGKKLLYVIITTVEGPVPNSHINLYDTNWQAIDTKKHFTPVSVANFINLPNKLRKERTALTHKILIPTIQYSMNDSTNNIIARPSFLQTLDNDTRLEIEQDFHKQLTLQWKAKKWKLAQQPPKQP